MKFRCLYPGLLLILLLSKSSSAQPWHVLTPVRGVPPHLVFLQPSATGYIFGGFRGFGEVNPLGEIIGWVEFPLNAPGNAFTYFQERSEGSQRRFLLGFRGSPGIFTMAEYWPDSGFYYTRRFVDTLEGPVSALPLFLQTSDTTLAAFGPDLIALPLGASTLLDATTPNATYLWSTGATTAAITINAVGAYTVTITPASGCPAVHTVQVVYPVGTHHPVGTPAWEILPNPAYDNAVVRCAECPPGAWRVVVYNAQGAQVAAVTGAAPRLGLNFGTLPSGVYAVALWQEGKAMGTRLVVRSER